MGLFTNEFIDIIDWPLQDGDTLMWKFPRHQNEIKMNAKLTVREGQQAVFINEGKIADVFGPGMYTLQTQNMPILSTLKGWKYGFDSPFKADVLFVSTRKAIDQKWGTRNAIIISDTRFGMIEMRAFGTYSFMVTDAGKFIKEITGIQEHYSNEDINGQLKSIITTRFSSVAGSGDIPIDRFAASLDTLSGTILDKMNADFESYGLKLTSFYIENVSMPEELRKEIFDYSRLGKVNTQQLAGLEAARSIPIAAANEGIGGVGASLGAGLSVGNMMAGAISQNVQQSPSGPPPLPVEPQYFTGINGSQAGPFSGAQLQQMVAAGTVMRDTLVWKTGMINWAPAQQVAEVAAMFTTPPPMNS